MLKLSDFWYNFLKFWAQIGLPASGSLYFGLAEIWGLPNADKVVGTIIVVDTFMGVMLGLSSASYNVSRYAGSLVRGVQDGRTVYMVDPSNLDLNDKQAGADLVFKLRNARPGEVSQG